MRRQSRSGSAAAFVLMLHARKGPLHTASVRSLSNAHRQIPMGAGIAHAHRQWVVSAGVDHVRMERARTPRLRAGRSDRYVQGAPQLQSGRRYSYSA